MNLPPNYSPPVIMETIRQGYVKQAEDATLRRIQALEGGILIFCKEAGLDREDYEAMCKLAGILNPGELAAGAWNSVKQTGLNLYDRAADTLGSSDPQDQQARQLRRARHESEEWLNPSLGTMAYNAGRDDDTIRRQRDRAQQTMNVASAPGATSEEVDAHKAFHDLTQGTRKMNPQQAARQIAAKYHNPALAKGLMSTFKAPPGMGGVAPAPGSDGGDAFSGHGAGGGGGGDLGAPAPGGSAGFGHRNVLPAKPGSGGSGPGLTSDDSPAPGGSTGGTPPPAPGGSVGGTPPVIPARHASV